MDDKDSSLINIDDTINLDDLLTDTITIDTSMPSSAYYYSTTGATGATGSYGNITINSSNYNGTWGSITNGSSFTSSNAGLHVTSNAEFDGDVKIKGVSILETLQTIEKRLHILRPDPAKLEHFEALKKAYEHYKTLEALCELPSKEEE